MQQSGLSTGELSMPPSSSAEPHPPLPLEVDDQYLYPSHADPQPADVVSLLKGFNLNVRVYSSYESLIVMESAYSVDEFVDWDRQKGVVLRSLHGCKEVLESAPPELTVHPFAPQSNAHVFKHPQPSYPTIGDQGYAPPYDPDLSENDRREVQFEIQKANIYVSHLSTRSFLVEKGVNLCKAHAKINEQHPESAGSVADIATWKVTEAELSTERDQIIKDLLIVLSSISQLDMEPNAESFVCLFYKWERMTIDLANLMC